MKDKVKGAAGMFFITITFLMTFILVIVLDFSRKNTLMGISNNIAHIVSTKIAIKCYNTDADSFTGKSGVITFNDGSTYNPSADFLDIAQSMNVKVTKYINPGNVDHKQDSFSWDAASKIATFQMSSIQSIDYPDRLIPYEQMSIIENY